MRGRKLLERIAGAPRVNDEGRISLAWWSHFLIGPMPVRIAITVAFLSLAVAVFSVTQLQKTVHQNTVLIHTQARDRGAAINANVRARHDDCNKLNALRAGLRRVVTEAQGQVAISRHAFPGLPPSYWRAQAKLYLDEIHTFHDDDCHAYAIDALPRRSEGGP